MRSAGPSPGLPGAVWVGGTGNAWSRQVSVTNVTDHAERSMSFGAIADDYDRLRPAPPPEAVDWLLPRRRDVVVDLGAGTGLLSRAITPMAGRVIAVGPDDRMRGAGGAIGRGGGAAGSR